MKYYEITVKTTHVASEIISDIMYEVTNDGVSIVDKEDLDIASWDYIEEGLKDKFPSEVLVKGYCSLDDIDKVIAQLKARFVDLTDCGSLDISTQILDDSVWKDEWKKNYFAIPIGRVIICPVWLDDGNPNNVLIDTGLAFGTGQHATTALCVELMQHIDLVDKTMLDIGCGSGVLGLCGAKLGCSHVVMVDNDEQATDTAQMNIKLNHFEDITTVITGNLTDKVDVTFDVVMANLTAPILQILVQDIAKVVKKGTRILLSGILNTYADQVKDAYSHYKLLEERIQGEWCALHYVVE